MKRNIEQEAADALLDVGISLPLLRVRLPFCRRAWTMRVTMRRPCLGNQIRIARHYLALGVTTERIERFTRDEEQAFLVRHGRRLSLMLALTICRGYLSGLLLAPIVAWLIRWKVPRQYQLEAQRRFRELHGTRDFMPITVWAERTNPFRPETGRPKSRKRGS